MAPKKVVHALSKQRGPRAPRGMVHARCGEIVARSAARGRVSCAVCAAVVATAAVSAGTQKAKTREGGGR